jgi:hypothetical protein
MRTLMVSNGWQHSCSAVRIRKNDFEVTHRFHCSCYAPSRDMGAKPDRLSVSGRSRHDVKRGRRLETLEYILYIIFWPVEVGM